MIIKVRPNGQRFKGLLTYLLEKERSAQPEVIHSNMCARTAGEYAAQMQSVAERGKARSGPVWHTIVSWHPSDHVTSADQVETVDRLMAAVGIDPAKHQFIAVVHHDHENPHLHLVVNRVGFDGSLFLNQRSGIKANVLRETMEQEKGWVIAEGRRNGHPVPGTDQPIRHREQRLGLRAAKHQVHEAVRSAIEASDGTWESFTAACESEQRVLPNLSFNQAGFNGASFTLLSAVDPNRPELGPDGDPWIFKGSQVGWDRQTLEGALLARRREVTEPGRSDQLPTMQDVEDARRGRRGPGHGSSPQRGPRTRGRGHRARVDTSTRRTAWQRLPPPRSGARLSSLRRFWWAVRQASRAADEAFADDISAAEVYRRRARAPRRPDRS